MMRRCRLQTHARRRQGKHAHTSGYSSTSAGPPPAQQAFATVRPCRTRNAEGPRGELPASTPKSLLFRDVFLPLRSSFSTYPPPEQSQGGILMLSERPYRENP